MIGWGKEKSDHSTSNAEGKRERRGRKKREKKEGEKRELERG